ncbi:MAG TPA: two-component regulator propeller domain-containing protein [Bryobacteraceae bacterium]|nr:two-component regulator propeller domain-containing protein [Bryobacteraceae bacterium]
MRSARRSLFLLAASAGILFALDPNRTLTQYVHRIWQVQQGLPESSIYAILQSSDGYLWLGTQTGLVRFDGVRFTTLESIYPSAPSNVWIRGIAQDRDGALWVGTNESGVFRILNGSIDHYSEKDGLPSDTVQSVVAAGNGDVWICTVNGLARFSGGKFTAYNTSSGLATNTLRAAAIDADGKVWVGGESPDLNVWNGSKFDSVALTAIPHDAGVRAILPSRDGTLWIGTTEGLIARKNGHERMLTTKDGLTDDWILNLTESADGSVWIGTRSGYSRWRNGEIDSFRPQDGLSQSTVYAISEDREGSLWVGTKHGLNQFLDGRSIPYTTNEGLPTNDTGPVVQDSGGPMWIGTLGAGLTRYDRRRFTVLTTREGLASNWINTLAVDPAGGLWVGTDRGLNLLRSGAVSATYTTAQGLPSNVIHSLFEDRSGVLWVGTDRGAARLRNGKLEGPFEHEPILAIGEDGAANIYLAAANSVFRFSAGKSTEILQNGSPLRGVDAFFRDRDGNLWMGMLGGGLRLLRGGQFASFYIRDGLFDTEIYGIVSDDQDRMWMACSKGIFFVPRADLLRFAAGKLKHIVSTPYSPTDALRVIECKAGVQPAASVTSDDHLWFSTIRGLIMFDPQHLQRNAPPPPIVIEDVTVNGEDQAPAAIARLAPGLKNLEFRYTGLSYLAPTRTVFRYRLEGFDKTWINAGTRREAFYTNLPPGTYTFRVIGCSIDGLCNDTGAAVDFTLASHYYQRIWFFPLLAACIGAGIFVSYRMRVHRLREQFHLILTERNRIARELHDTLIQGLSGITMEMQALLGRMRSPEERGSLEEIIRDAGACLRETRRSVAGLRSGGSGLASAIEQAARQITEAKDVRLKLKLENKPSGLAPDVEYNLVRIAQEAVTNSVKHSGARNVEVALDFTPKALHLSVRDDGSGFSDSNGKHGHYGLIGMKERATHIGADLELATAPGRGTTVSVVLPGQNGNHE